MVNHRVRAVVTADNHLNRFYDRMSPQKLARRRKYLRDGFRAAVDHALEWPADLFLIAGDLFDQPDPRNVDRAFVADCLAQLNEAGIRVFAIGGNHDTPRQSTEQGGTAPQEVYAYLQALTWFDSSTEILPEVVEVNGLRVAVAGLAANPAAATGSDPLAGMTWGKDAASYDCGILLLHGQVEGFAPPETRAPVIALASLEQLAAADVVVVGDIHRPSTRRIGERLLIIPGATERMTFGESPDVPGFGELEMVRGQPPSYQRVRLAGQPRAELRVRIADLDPKDELEQLVEQIKNVASPETMVRLSLEGILPRERYHALQLRRLVELVSPLLFHFTLDTSGLLLEDERHDAASHGVRMSQQEELKLYADALTTTMPADSPEHELIHAALERLLSRY